jgi:pimeloyl-ACP methyl ester carboxylesterase
MPSARRSSQHRREATRRATVGCRVGTHAALEHLDRLAAAALVDAHVTELGAVDEGRVWLSRLLAKLKRPLGQAVGGRQIAEQELQGGRVMETSSASAGRPPLRSAARAPALPAHARASPVRQRPYIRWSAPRTGVRDPECRQHAQRALSRARFAARAYVQTSAPR